jgi:hypothetical protein
MITKTSNKHQRILDMEDGVNGDIFTPCGTCQKQVHHLDGVPPGRLESKRRIYRLKSATQERLALQQIAWLYIFPAR